VTGNDRTAAVTGAGGYLGSRICAGLAGMGWRVVRLVRDLDPADPDARRFVLGEEVEEGTFRSIDLLVHTAYDFSLTRAEDIWRVNVEGTRRLLMTAKRADVRRILVLSTMSAYEGTRQLYGSAKLDIEAEALAVGGCALRPGLVYGDQPSGMAGALLKLTRLPVVPLVAGEARQFPVHVDDLTAAIVALADAEEVPPQAIGVAQPTPVTFRDLMSGLAAREGRRCRFVTIPWRPVYWGMQAMERVGIPLPFRADSLLGLVRPAPCVPGAEILHDLGVTLRNFEANA
jgi:nucleoside-diphosphate-sugar epimerase